MGCSTTDGLLRHSPSYTSFLSPIVMVALRTSPPSSLNTSGTLSSSLRGASSWMMTMSLTCTFCLGACHFCLRVFPARYSFLHLHQNCSDRYCTRLHLFLAYKSSLTWWGEWDGGFHHEQMVWCQLFEASVVVNTD